MTSAAAMTSTTLSPRAGADYAIRVSGLSKRYEIETASAVPHLSLLAPLRWAMRRGGSNGEAKPPRSFLALDDVSFEIGRGERVAIIGRNGAGKSTLLKILSRIVTPTRGEARIRGRVTSLLEVGTGFSPTLTGRENIYVNASMHGLSRKETDARLEDIIEFSGIEPQFLDMRVKHYSSGMRVRLAFSVAAHLEPDIMLLDEVLAVGDLAFQEKCLARVEGMMAGRRTVLFVSHSMDAVTRFCERAIWLDGGRVRMDGDVLDVVGAYTQHSRRAVPVVKFDRAAVSSVPEPEPTPAVAASDPSASLQPTSNGHALDEGAAARFVSFCVVNESHEQVANVTVDQRFGIEFVYDVLRPGKIVLPAVTFSSPEKQHLFSIVYTNDDYMSRPKDPGRYQSIVWVPAHLMNVGTFLLTPSVTSPVSGKLERHEVLDHAMTLDVYEAPFGKPSARGAYRELKGAVRPLCEWETLRVE